MIGESFSTVFIMKESIIHGIEFAILDIIVEFLTHYIYDRIWLKIKWGIVVVPLEKVIPI
jgi:uncharacterized membrane protein